MRFPDYKNGLVDSPYEGGNSMKKLILRSKQLHSKRNALGTIVR